MATTTAANPSTVLSDALQRGEYCCVVAPGTVSPLIRAQAAARLRAASLSVGGEGREARSESTAIVVLNLAAIGPCSGSDEWYARLLSQLALQLDLSDELSAFWQAEQPRGPLQRWMAALQEVVLQVGERRGARGERDDGRTLASRPLSLASRVVIFVEALDAVRELPFSADEFISAIRECYNRRPRDPAFDRLTFCLLSPVPIASLIRDPGTTWFNIGRRIEVTERSDAAADAPQQGGRSTGTWVSVMLQRAREWICGEPYSCMDPLLSVRPAAACG
jgi:hypothetical protein